MKKHTLLMSLAGLLIVGCQQKGDHHFSPTGLVEALGGAVDKWH